MMILCGMGSLNRMHMARRLGVWRARRMGIPSADTIARATRTTTLPQLRQVGRTMYRRLRRSKALESGVGRSYFMLVVDGHECCCSYRRHCPKCLTRRIQVTNGTTRIQYYHRLVAAVLVCNDFVLALDVEMQQPREGEVQCAMRLFERIMDNYPKAFELLGADGLYAQKPFVRLVRKHHKHCIIVLKDERRELLAAARQRFGGTKPCLSYTHNGTHRQVWDSDICAHWANRLQHTRVVRSVETKRQRDPQTNESLLVTSEWYWFTTMPHAQMDTRTLVEAAHRRWDIENRCFNDLVTNWHIGHVYTHDVNAIAVFWLLTMLMANLLHVFYRRNLKPARRDTITMCMLAAHIAAQALAYTSTDTG
jgi:hypothetical protein